MLEQVKCAIDVKQCFKIFGKGKQVFWFRGGFWPHSPLYLTILKYNNTKTLKEIFKMLKC